MRSIGQKCVYFSIVALACLCSYELVTAADLTVRIVNARSDEGVVNVKIMQESPNWPSADPVQSKQATLDKNGTAVVQFKDLSPSNYAIAAFHDENQNEKIDRNPMGIPTERFGFSNNAKARMGKPKWEEATFLLEDDMEIIIKLH